MYLGSVTSVKKGKQGMYAIAVCDTVAGSVTFSLNASVWQEKKRRVRIGDKVVLKNLRRSSAGWRAMSVRLMRPEDEQSSNARLPNRATVEKNHGKAQSRYPGGR